MAYAVNHLGATDLNCAYGSFAVLWLAGGHSQRRGVSSGWANTCPSWLDPQPEREVPAWCAEIERSVYVRDISRSPSWVEWGLQAWLDDDDGTVNYEWAERTYCTWMVKCIDVAAAVAPGSSEAQRHNTCGQRIAPQIIVIARRGRCGGLRMLADIALLWARGEALPNVAERSGDQLITC